tara:strand:- start:20593 stop:20898 length:306 start_codon:yes stop_codon:yes gene_type:complete
MTGLVEVEDLTQQFVGEPLSNRGLGLNIFLQLAEVNLAVGAEGHRRFGEAEAHFLRAAVEAELLEVTGFAHQLAQIHQPLAACGGINPEGDSGHAGVAAAG